MALFSYTPAESRQKDEASTSKQVPQENQAAQVETSGKSSPQDAGAVQSIPLAALPQKPAIIRPCRAVDTSFVSFQLFTETMSFDW